MANARDTIINRITQMAIKAGENPEEAVALNEFGRNPRYSMKGRWIEFECGCRMLRFQNNSGILRPSDPIIFRGLPEQAVYDLPCNAHLAGVNKYIGLSGQYKDFQGWKSARFKLITGA